MSLFTPHDGVLTFVARGRPYLFSHVGAYLIRLTIQNAKSESHPFSHIDVYLIGLTIQTTKSGSHPFSHIGAYLIGFTIQTAIFFKIFTSFNKIDYLDFFLESLTLISFKSIFLSFIFSLFFHVVPNSTSILFIFFFIFSKIQNANAMPQLCR